MTSQQHAQGRREFLWMAAETAGWVALIVVTTGTVLATIAWMRGWI